MTRVLAIGLASVSALAIAAWITSAKWSLGWQASNFQTSVAGGSWQVTYWSTGYYGLPSKGPYFNGWGGGFRWWRFHLGLPDRGDLYSVVVPMWAFALLTGAWPLWFWVRHCRHGRRRRRSQCPKCGYLLKGLTDPVVCPECGRRESV